MAGTCATIVIGCRAFSTLPAILTSYFLYSLLFTSPASLPLQGIPASTDYLN